MSERISNGISITTQCYDCLQADDLCLECTENREARDSQVAHQLVDEGNLQYKSQWMNITEPSAHDWTEREGEYRLPIVFLQDGGTYEELWELDDMTQQAREIECQWCHLMTPKAFNDCQDCDKPLESNVR
jgi:hypothetical protein